MIILDFLADTQAQLSAGICPNDPNIARVVMQNLKPMLHRVFSLEEFLYEPDGIIKIKFSSPFSFSNGMPKKRGSVAMNFLLPTLWHQTCKSIHIHTVFWVLLFYLFVFVFFWWLNLIKINSIVISIILSLLKEQELLWCCIRIKCACWEKEFSVLTDSCHILLWKWNSI